MRLAGSSMRDGDFATAFAKMAQGMAAGVPESEWVAELRLVAGRLIVETASRLITADHTNEIVEAAYEALITAEPWDRRHFDGLMSHHREAGDEAAALDVERRWFADDS
ncbi:hypothetical protein N9812_00850 [bacterium]|nr:hypothetical protein [bacterium]